MKLSTIIILILILISSITLCAHEESASLKPPTNMFAGFGPAFSVFGGALGFAQVGGDFYISGTENLNLWLGPQANIYFAHHDFNFRIFGHNFKLGHQKIFSNNTRLDFCAGFLYK